MLEAEVVADRGKHRAIGGQRNGRQARAVEQESAHQLRRQMLRLGSAAAIPEHEHFSTAAKALDQLFRGKTHLVYGQPEHACARPRAVSWSGIRQDSRQCFHHVFDGNASHAVLALTLVFPPVVQEPTAFETRVHRSARSPSGPHRTSEVGPLRPTVSAPVAAARCMMPVFTLTTPRLPARRSTNLTRSYLPARIGHVQALRAAAGGKLREPATSPGPPVRTIRRPRPFSSLPSSIHLSHGHSFSSRRKSVGQRWNTTYGSVGSSDGANRPGGSNRGSEAE